MVKAITGGFSAVRDFINQKQGLVIDSYAITGSSKRGWNSWLACAYDTRCVVALPKIFDMLDVVPSMKQHYMALGGWSRTFEPYWEEGMTEMLDTHEMREISCMIDPLHSIDKLKKKRMFLKFSFRSLGPVLTQKTQFSST